LNFGDKNPLERKVSKKRKNLSSLSFGETEKWGKLSIKSSTFSNNCIEIKKILWYKVGIVNKKEKLSSS